VHEPGTVEQVLVAAIETELLAGFTADRGDRPRVTQCVRRLQVDEVRDTDESRVQALAGERDAQGRLGADDGFPGRHRLQPVENAGCVLAKHSASVWVELATTALTRKCGRCIDPTDTMRDFDVLRKR